MFVKDTQGDSFPMDLDLLIVELFLDLLLL